MITRLDDLLELVKTKEKKRLVAAYANDSHTIGAISAAVDKGIVDAMKRRVIAIEDGHIVRDEAQGAYGYEN